MCECGRKNNDTESEWGFVRSGAGELAFEPETLEMERPTVTLGGPPSKTKIELDILLDALAKGTTDPNKLTDLIFFRRHPELGGRKLRPGENKLINEWNSIRGLVSAAITIDSIRKLKTF